MKHFVLGAICMLIVGFVLLSLVNLNNRITNIERFLSQQVQRSSVQPQPVIKNQK